MSSSENVIACHPCITFQDTDVVGNVYFLTFFRWQAEFRDQWLRVARPNLWRQIVSGERRLFITHWSTRFEDPFGATIGDKVTATLSMVACSDDCVSANTEATRQTPDAPARIAAGSMSFTTRTDFDTPRKVRLSGRCYSFVARPSAPWYLDAMDLLEWQGKCREVFLAEYAPDTIRLVTNRDVILQTTTASFDLIKAPELPLEEVRVEMRLQTLKCGQMGVRFDYFAESPTGTSVWFASGSQRMSAKRHSSGGIVPSPLPTEVLVALRQFTVCEKLLTKIEDIMGFSGATRGKPNSASDASHRHFAREGRAKAPIC